MKLKQKLLLFARDILYIKEQRTMVIYVTSINSYCVSYDFILLFINNSNPYNNNKYLKSNIQCI